MKKFTIKSFEVNGKTIKAEPIDIPYVVNKSDIIGGYGNTGEVAKRHNLLLNGKYYGTGDLRYIHELITDYISSMESFGVEEVVFKIEKRGD